MRKVSGPLLNSVGRYSSAFTEGGHAQTNDCHKFLRLSLHSLLTPGFQRTASHKATTMPTVDSKASASLRTPSSATTVPSSPITSTPIPFSRDRCWTHVGGTTNERIVRMQIKR